VVAAFVGRGAFTIAATGAGGEPDNINQAYGMWPSSGANEDRPQTGGKRQLAFLVTSVSVPSASMLARTTCAELTPLA